MYEDALEKYNIVWTGSVTNYMFIKGNDIQMSADKRVHKENILCLLQVG